MSRVNWLVSKIIHPSDFIEGGPRLGYLCLKSEHTVFCFQKTDSAKAFLYVINEIITFGSTKKIHQALNDIYFLLFESKLLSL